MYTGTLFCTGGQAAEAQAVGRLMMQAFSTSIEKEVRNET